MEREMLIFNLNKALQLEYSDVFLYPREAKLIKDKIISETFEEFGLMEIRHADMLAQRILDWGGKPLWDFTLWEDKKGLSKMIARHLDYENRAIDFYTKLIPEGDKQTRILIRGIKAEEETHLSKLKEFFKSLK